MNFAKCTLLLLITVCFADDESDNSPQIPDMMPNFDDGETPDMEAMQAMMKQFGMDNDQDSTQESFPAPEVPVTSVESKPSCSNEISTNVASTSHEFTTDHARILHVVYDKLYTNRDAAIRELIANSCDALDKAEHTLMASGALVGELEIRVEYDAEAKKLSFTDTGIGMNLQQLVENLGTIARSGSSEFIESIERADESEKLNLIGQFGIGFYSAFLLAQEVVVVSKSIDSDTQNIWTSRGDGSFSTFPDPNPELRPLSRGTRVILNLKDDALDYLSDTKLMDTIKQYSQFARHPIYLRVSETRYRDVPTEEVVEESTPKEDSDVALEEDESESEPKTKSEAYSVFLWKLVNIQQPIWLRPKSEITGAEYDAFCRHISGDSQNPLSRVHFSAEGSEADFKSILCIPRKASQKHQQAYQNDTRLIQLYVQRVLVEQGAKELLPRYLSFVYGIVDSESVALNVNRDYLQESAALHVIGRRLVNKALDLVRTIAEESDELRKTRQAALESAVSEEEIKEAKANMKKTLPIKTFDREFGQLLRVGCSEDSHNRSRIARALRYATAKNPDNDVIIGLSEYISNMPADQKSIYYISGGSVPSMSRNPIVQTALSRGYDVLFLETSNDEGCLSQLSTFEGKSLENIEKADLPVNSSEEHRLKAATTHFSSMTQLVKKLLGSKFKFDSVAVSARLGNLPFMMVPTKWGHSAAMQRSLKSQGSSDVWGSSKSLEINPDSIIIQNMNDELQSAFGLSSTSTVDEIKAATKTATIKDMPKSLKRRLYQYMYAATVVGGFDIIDIHEFANLVSLHDTNVDNLDGLIKRFEAPEPQVPESTSDETTSASDSEEFMDFDNASVSAEDIPDAPTFMDSMTDKSSDEL